MAEIKQRADGSLAIYREGDTKELLTVGGPVVPDITNKTSPGLAAGFTFLGKSVVKIPLGTGAAGTANLASVKLSDNDDHILGHTVVNITTGQSLSLDLSLGTGASSSTFANNLIDAVNLSPDAAGVGVYDNVTDKGTAGKSRQLLSAGQFITVTSSRTVGTLQGYVTIDAVKV